MQKMGGRRVSPDHGYAYGANTSYAIVGRNDGTLNRAQDVWARIDKIAGCPQEIFDLARRTVVGV